LEILFFKLKQAPFLLFALFFCNIVQAQKPRFLDKKIAKRIEKHVTFLASNELEGRKMASAGEYKAASYIAENFQKIGLVPNGNNGYMQDMTVPNLRMAQANSSLMLNDNVLTLFTEYFPLSESANNGRYKGDAVNLNHGIIDGGLKHDDYAEKDVKGKVVLIDLDIPGGLNEHNRYMSWAGTELRTSMAISKGVRGIIYYSASKKLAPSGTLANTVNSSGIPVLFVKKDLSEYTTVPVDLNLDILLMSTNAQNVLGLLDNGAPKTIVIASHHDHLGREKEGEQSIYHGANDATGTAVLIELAKRIKKKKKRFSKYNYLFISFTGNKDQMSGSQYFFKKELIQLEKINCMINLDGLGGLDSTKKSLIVEGLGTAENWNASLATPRIAKRKLTSINSPKTLTLDSDHKYFYANYIPVLNYNTPINPARQTEQSSEFINYAGAAFITKHIYKSILSIENQEFLEHKKIEINSTKP